MRGSRWQVGRQAEVREVNPAIPPGAGRGERMEAGYGFQAISTSNKNPEQPSECLLRS